MKKIIALLLATLMVVGMFTGCGPASTNKPGGTANNYQGGELEFPYEVDENGDPVYGDLFANDTIDWWISSNYHMDSNTWIFKKSEEVLLVFCPKRYPRHKVSGAFLFFKLRLRPFWSAW